MLSPQDPLLSQAVLCWHLPSFCFTRRAQGRGSLADGCKHRHSSILKLVLKRHHLVQCRKGHAARQSWQGW